MIFHSYYYGWSNTRTLLNHSTDQGPCTIHGILTDGNNRFTEVITNRRGPVFKCKNRTLLIFFHTEEMRA